MALTQVRAAGAFTGGRYGSFAGRGDGAHPVDAITQARAAAAHTGGRYGSFAGRDAGSHPVVPLTQARASGAHTGRRYGSFDGRAAQNGRITQARAFGPHTGRRYGSFDGRPEYLPPTPGPIPGPGLSGGRRIHVPPALLDDLRQRLIDEDELLLLMAAFMAATGQLH